MHANGKVLAGARQALLILWQASALIVPGHYPLALETQALVIEEFSLDKSQDQIGVFGAGAYGRAVAHALTAQGWQVAFYARPGPGCQAAKDQDWRLFPAEQLIAEARVLLLGIPAQAHASFLSDHHEALASRGPFNPVLSLAKGIDRSQGLLLPQLDWPHPLGLISGPSFAADLMADKPTALNLAYPNLIMAHALAEALSGPRLRLYTSDDVAGIALAGAMKNVIALGCGVLDGAGLGESARSALMARGMSEIARLLKAVGGQSNTLISPAGVGDLALTCGSTKSRNYQFGFALGAGIAPPDSLVEGVATASAALALAKRQGIELPITQAVETLVEGKRSVAETIACLMSRPLPR